MFKKIVMISVFFISFCTTSFLFADVVDPTEEACARLEVGDVCSDSGNTCQEGECCRNDYSNGVPPEVVCEACLVCKSVPTGGQAMGGQAMGGQSTGGQTMNESSEEGSTSDMQEVKSEGCASIQPSLNPFGLFCGLIGLLMLVALRKSRI